MTKTQARTILGNQPKWALRNMARALGMLTYLNTEADWERAAALRVLGYRNAPKRPTEGETV